MTDFRDVPARQRFEQGFVDSEGQMRCVWADYAIQGPVRVIVHVEAEPQLRGSGAAGRFMERLAGHARAEGLRLRPRCGYAVAWFRRRPDFADVLDPG